MIAAQYEPVRVAGGVSAAEASVLGAQANRFLTILTRTFESRRQELLDERQARARSSAEPEFRAETAHIRGGEWKVAAPWADLLDRRVELVGPADRWSIAAGMNVGAKVYVADVGEGPTLSAQVDLREAVTRACQLDEAPPALMLRPRGWHQDEDQFLVDGRPIPAALFDCGLYLFHNARPLIASGTAPYFCLAGVENHGEARLWNELFLVAQEHLRISRGTVRAAVEIEGGWAAFEMDEILWELGEHSAGLVGEGDALVETCHRRGTHAIGGMRQTRSEHLQQVWAGYDGTRVGDGGAVAAAQDVFDTYVPFPNQIGRKHRSLTVAAR